MQNLYRFYWNAGRWGELESLFFATEKQIKDLIGKTVYFGDVLGKHSDVDLTIEAENIKKIELSEETLKELHLVLTDSVCGYNPLTYLRDDDYDEY